MPPKTVKVTSHEDAIKQISASAEESITVTPNSAWADELCRRLLPKEDGVLFDKKIVSVRDFVREMSRSANAVISSSMQRAIIRKLLKNTEAKYFKTASNGTVNLFSRSISALKKNGVTPAELENILQTRGGSPEADLLKIYFKYEAELNARKLSDEESLYNFKPPKENVALFGFDSLEPWADKLNGTFFDIEPIEQPPEVYSFNSPGDEIDFIAENISKTVNAGIYILDDETAWRLSETLTGVPRFTPHASLLASLLFNLQYPPTAAFSEFTKIAVGMLQNEYKNIAQKNTLTSRHASYINHFHSLLKRLEYEHGEEIFSKDEFLSLLFDDLPNYPLPDFIKFARLENAGLYQFDAVFLPSANESGLSSSGNSHKFFSSLDTLSPEPDERIDRIFPSQKKLIERELKRFYLACQKNAVVTFPIHNENGKDASPSPFIIKYKCAHVPPKFRIDEKINDECGTNFESREALKELEFQLSSHKFSATQLEEFGNCPFAYFCRRILGIEPPEEITPEVQAKDRGTLIHQILEEYFISNGKIYEKLIKNGGKAEFSPIIKKITDSVFLKRNDITQKYHKDMVEYFKKRSWQFVVSVLESELEFLRNIPSKPAPSCFELEFDDTLNGIPIRGKIDRIDCDGEYITVIDYKSGETGSARSGIEEGTKLQLPIYIEMARRLLKKEPIAGFLYSIKKQKRATGIAKKEFNKTSIGLKTHHFLLENEKWDELITLGIKTACEYAKKIKSGKFRSVPHECKSYCDWKDVCRYNV